MYIPTTQLVQVPSGFELSYVERTTSQSIDSTTEATPTTIITAADLTVGGSTRVRIEFNSRSVSTPSSAVGDVSVVNLHVSTNGGVGFTDLGRIAVYQTPAAAIAVAAPCYIVRYLTPAAGTAQYRIVAWASSTTGGPTVSAGAGGAGVDLPMFLRVSIA